ncbi:MAG TPA: hypothetical protein EYG03_07670 [Planctomycetes bacterium]|nr:hypothetical protein [Planctomycetota bacterium]
MLHWKRDGSISRRELFNLTNSPTEEGHNVAATQAAKADELQQQLEQFLERVNADKPPAKSPRKRNKK